MKNKKNVVEKEELSAEGKPSRWKRFKEKFIKPWFYSTDDPYRIKPAYVITFVMLALTLIVIVLQITIVLQCYKSQIEQKWTLTQLAGILMASAGGFVALYNQGRRNAINLNKILLQKGITLNGKGELSFREWFIKPWFFSHDDPTKIKAPYVIAFIMIMITVIVVVLEIYLVMSSYDKKSDQGWSLTPLAGVMMTSAQGFILLYNVGRRNIIQQIQSQLVSGESDSPHEAPQQSRKGSQPPVMEMEPAQEG